MSTPPRSTKRSRVGDVPQHSPNNPFLGDSSPPTIRLPSGPTESAEPVHTPPRQSAALRRLVDQVSDRPPANYGGLDVPLDAAALHRPARTHRAGRRAQQNVPALYTGSPLPAFFVFNADTLPPNEGTTTLLDVLDRIVFPPSPPYYAPKALTSTRMPKLRKRRPNYYLRDVKHEPNMFADLRDEVREALKKIIIDFANPDHRAFLAVILPCYTVQLLTERIHCERDLEDVIRIVHLRPALAIVRAIELGRIPTSSQLRAKKKGYFSAPVQERIAGIPDFLLIKGNRKHPKENIRLRGEVKSSRVLHVTGSVCLPVASETVVEEEDQVWDPYEAEDDVEVSESSDDEAGDAGQVDPGTPPRPTPIFSSDAVQEHAFEHYEDISETVPIANHVLHDLLQVHQDDSYAMRFAWPTAKHAGIKITHASAVIMQIWEQLLRGKREREHRTILSCYGVTTFGARRGTTLYLSDNYTFNSSYLLLDLVCMISRCLHVTKSRLRLPEVNNTWWMQSDVDEAAETTIGIIPETLPPMARNNLDSDD